MILDFIILRHGLPVFSINFDPQHGLSHDQKKFTLISGFFSAISSFVDSMDNIGQVDEIQMSSDIFFTFKRTLIEDAEYLFILCSNQETQKRIRKEIIEDSSREFLHQFDAILHEKWDGNVNKFNEFHSTFIQIMKNYLRQIDSENIIEGSDKIENDIQNNTSNQYRLDTGIMPVINVQNFSPLNHSSERINSECNRNSNPSNQRFNRYQTLQYYQKYFQPNTVEKERNGISTPSMPWSTPNAWTTHGVEMQLHNHLNSRTESSFQDDSQIETMRTQLLQARPIISETSANFKNNLQTEALFDNKNTKFMKGHIIQQSVFDLIPIKHPITVETFRREFNNPNLKMLFVAIDGRKSINTLAKYFESSPSELLEACQYLAKKGLIKLTF